MSRIKDWLARVRKEGVVKAVKEGIARVDNEGLAKVAKEGAVKVLKDVTGTPEFKHPSVALGPPLSQKHILNRWKWSKSQISGKTLSLKGLATPKRFRVIDCEAYCNADSLEVLECDINFVSYAAISHVWKGELDPTKPSSFSMEVENLDDDGDQISLEVFRTACLAAIRQGVRYLWVDRLCIMQTFGEDKRWHIQNMAEIYRKCHMCLVLPGGLSKLVGFGETTGWIYRSWTLQEAVLPKDVWCVFRWEAGDGRWMDGDKATPDGAIMEIQKRLSAMSRLRVLLNHSSGRTSFESERVWKTKDMDKPFLSKDTEPVRALSAAMNSHGSESREISVWRCMMTRTSKRKVDAVLSIMGFFGVALDPRDYGPDDQFQATVDLCKRIMRRKDGRANWLGASAKLYLSPETCAMPFMPLKEENEIPVVRHRGARVPSSNMVRDLDWKLKDAPKGMVSDSGSIQFTAPLSAITIGDITPLKHHLARDHGPLGFESAAIVTASAQHESEAHFAGEAGTHAVVIGKTAMLDIKGQEVEQDEFVVLMILKQCADWDGWYKVGMATVRPEFTRTWKMRTIRVGGSAETLSIVGPGSQGRSLLRSFICF